MTCRVSTSTCHQTMPAAVTPPHLPHQAGPKAPRILHLRGYDHADGAGQQGQAVVFSLMPAHEASSREQCWSRAVSASQLLPPRPTCGRTARASTVRPQPSAGCTPVALATTVCYTSGSQVNQIFTTHTYVLWSAKAETARIFLSMAKHLGKWVVIATPSSSWLPELLCDHLSKSEVI